MQYVRRPNPWVFLAGTVIAIDAVQIRRRRVTLTASFRSAMRHPRRRWYVLAAWGVLSSHLVLGRP